MCVDGAEKDDKIRATWMEGVDLPPSLFFCVPLLLIVCCGLDGERHVSIAGGEKEGAGRPRATKKWSPKQGMLCLSSGQMTHWITGCQTLAFHMIFIFLTGRKKKKTIL